jgi:hypothetical protein
MRWSVLVKVYLGEGLLYTVDCTVYSSTFTGRDLDLDPDTDKFYNSVKSLANVVLLSLSLSLCTLFSQYEYFNTSHMIFFPCASLPWLNESFQPI